MAAVYRATDTVLGRTVAVKVLHQSYAEDEHFRLRFKQEARAMASLDHENIVKVYDISEDDESPFIVAEFVDGRDVGTMLRSEKWFTERFTRRVAIQLLRALAYAHRRGIVHRDIKPSNIIITPDGTVKVADFGIARLAEGEDVGRPGEIIGSARYMSPEQLTGEETTPRSDIYSVGIFLYHCLTGSTPFNGDTKALARQQVYNEARSPRMKNQEISPQMEHVILRALSKRPSTRYPTATAMLDAIRVPSSDSDDPELETGAGGMAGTAAGYEAATATATRRTKSRSGQQTRERRDRSPGLLVSVLLVALILFVGAGTAVGLTYLTGDGEESAPIGSQQGQPLGQQEEQAAGGGPATENGSEEGAGEPPGGVPGEATTETPEETAPGGATVPEAPGVPDGGAGEITGEEPDELELAVVPETDLYFDCWSAEFLQREGFDVAVVYQPQTGVADNGVTWASDPAPGAEVEEGSTVTVYATPITAGAPRDCPVR